jgi:peptide/nickel transport system substrate-binding protein
MPDHSDLLNEALLEDLRSNRISRKELLRRGLAGAVLLGSGGLLGACGGDGGGSGTQDQPSGGAQKQKRGGTLRVGTAGGSSSDTIDAHTPTTHPDQARVVQLNDSLARYNPDFELELSLAEEFTAEKADVWLIRLRSGLEFHDGKTVTADDVIFSLRRIIDPDIPAFGAGGLTSLDPNGMKKLDERTVRLTLKQPDVTIRDELGQYFNGIVPVGYNSKKPVGVGPFMYESFTPGQESKFVRNPNYWREGEPYANEIIIIDFPDSSARVNALSAGQVDAIDDVPFGQVPVVEGNANLRILEAPSGGWLPFTMRIDAPPFDDNRVRQAMRLLVNRQEMLDQALAGHGKIGNDLYSPFDPCYADDLPQREQDIDQAKSLLKQAGQSNLTVDLQTADVAAGLIEAAQVIAEQAKAAGVTINVNKLDSGTFYGDNYLKWTFAQDFWGSRHYLQQAAAGSLPDSAYNETQWPPDDTYINLINEARRTLDENKRCEILHDAQELEYNEGGHIIWAFFNHVDAHSAKITGLVPDRGTLPLNQYGFSHVSFVE